MNQFATLKLKFNDYFELIEAYIQKMDKKLHCQMLSSINVTKSTILLITKEIINIGK